MKRFLEDSLHHVQHEARLAGYRVAVQGRGLSVLLTEASNLTPCFADVVVRWNRQVNGPRVREVQLSPAEGPDTAYSFRVDPPRDPHIAAPINRDNGPYAWTALTRQPNLLALRIAAWLGPASIAFLGGGPSSFEDRSERRAWTEEARALAERGIRISDDLPLGDRQPVAFRPAESVIVSVNPNAESMWRGHFVGFDRRLREQALAHGSALLLLGHQRLERGEGFEPWMVPLLDRRTSGSHVIDPTHVTPFNVDTVERLRYVLDEVSTRFEEVTIFWYLGAAEYVPTIETLASEYPSVTWHLHLFWDFLVDTHDTSATRRFRELLARVNLLPSVRLSVGTESLLDDLNRILPDSPLLLLPDGPSVTIPDNEARSMILRPTSPPGDAPYRVLCPGGHAVGKNWTVGATVLRELVRRHGGDYEASLRFIEAQATREEKRLAQSLADEEHLELIQGPLGADELLAMLDGTDVTFLPYGSDLFAHRSSGLLTEAIICGSRIVCFEDTYLAWVVEKHGLGTVVPERAGIEVCIEAIIEEAARTTSNSATDVHARLNYLDTTSWRRIHSVITGARP